MKKRNMVIVVLTLAMLATLLYGCGEKEYDTGTFTSEEDTLETSIDDGTLAVSPIELYTVDIKREMLEEETYTANLIYPQIVGLNDTEIEEKVNALIRSYVSRKMNESVSEASGGGNVEYNVTSFDATYRGNALFSAILRGNVSIEGDAYPTDFSYGINVDLKGAKLIGLDELIEYKGFESDFENGVFKQTRGYDKLCDEANYSDLISQYDPLYSIYPEFYIRNTDGRINLGIITETIHVLGDVAEFEADISGKKYIKDYFFELTDIDSE